MGELVTLIGPYLEVCAARFASPKTVKKPAFKHLASTSVWKTLSVDKVCDALTHQPFDVLLTNPPRTCKVVIVVRFPEAKFRIQLGISRGKMLKFGFSFWSRKRFSNETADYLEFQDGSGKPLLPSDLRFDQFQWPKTPADRAKVESLYEFAWGERNMKKTLFDTGIKGSGPQHFHSEACLVPV